MQGCPDCYDPKQEIKAYVRQSGVPYTLITCSGFAEDWAAALGQMGLRWEPPGPNDETIVFGSGNQKGRCTPQVTLVHSEYHQTSTSFPI